MKENELLIELLELLVKVTYDIGSIIINNNKYILIISISTWITYSLAII